ncbi:hypothetical protein [[Eubacterium] cellulosolvens]
MAVAALLGCIGLLKRKPWGMLFALLAGSAGIFLGLMDLLFDLENEILLNYWSLAPTEVATEIVIVIVLLTIGPAIIWYVRTRRQCLL